MGKRDTEMVSTYDPTVGAAAGIHDPDKARTYMFAEFLTPSGRPKQSISVGRGKSCDISVRDTNASVKHLVLERQPRGHMVVQDRDSTNGVYVNGEAASRPFVLEVGMRLKIGYARLYAVNDAGLYPIQAPTIDEFMRLAAKIYGNNTIAGIKVGVSRESVRRRVAPQPAKR